MSGQVGWVPQVKLSEEQMEKVEWSVELELEVALEHWSDYKVAVYNRSLSDLSPLGNLLVNYHTWDTWAKISMLVNFKTIKKNAFWMFY
jgi:hypothetical protein